MAQLRLAYSNSQQQFPTKKPRSAKCCRLPKTSSSLPPVAQKALLLHERRPHGAAIVEELIDRLLQRNR